MVSIVMPAFNAAAYIIESIDSVLRQTYRDWELILVDDASRDGTAELVRRHYPDRVLETGPEDTGVIRLFRNAENLGVAASRNRGVQLAHGNWIAFLDADDVWEPEKLMRQMELLRQHGYSGGAMRNPEASGDSSGKLPDPEGKYLLFTGSGFMDAGGRRLSFTLHVPERIDYRTLLRQNLVSCSSVLVSRELMLRYPMPERDRSGRPAARPEKPIHEDFVSWLRILRDPEVPYAYGIDAPLLIYRLSASSKSADKRKAALMNWNTYREVGLSVPAALSCMVWYTLKGLWKYARLRLSGAGGRKTA